MSFTRNRTEVKKQLMSSLRTKIQLDSETTKYMKSQIIN